MRGPRAGPVFRPARRAAQCRRGGAGTTAGPPPAGCPPAGVAAPAKTPRGAPPGSATGEEGDTRPRRASIGAMVASKLTMLTSKLTINARMPESVRVRVHLRWLGSLPRRVPVNARERFSHESVPTACFHPPPGRRGPARPPDHPPGALAPDPPRRHRRGALRHFRRLNVLNPSSNRPRAVPPASPHRSYPAHAARRTSGWPPQARRR